MESQGGTSVGAKPSQVGVATGGHSRDADIAGDGLTDAHDINKNNILVKCYWTAADNSKHLEHILTPF